jgi:hypothetical protein
MNGYAPLGASVPPTILGESLFSGDAKEKGALMTRTKNTKGEAILKVVFMQLYFQAPVSER